MSDLSLLLSEAERRGDAELINALQAVMQRQGEIAADKGAERHGNSIANTYLNMATFGLGDDILAGIMAVPASLQLGQGYDETRLGLRDEMRTQYDKAYEDKPILAGAAELAGVLSPGAIAGGVLSPMLRGASNAGKLAMSGVAGAAGGATSMLGNSRAETTDEVLEDAAMGGASGLLAGGAFPAAGQAMGGTVEAIRAPWERTKEYARQVGVLLRENMPLSGGMVSGNRALRQMESTLADLPLVGAPIQKQKDNLASAFQRRLFNMVAPGVGDQTDGMLTWDNLETLRKSLGDEYRAALGGKNLSLKTSAFESALDDIQKEYDKIPGRIKGVAKARIKDVKDFLKSDGEMTFDQYQQYRSYLTDQARGNSKDAAIYGKIRDAVDDAFRAAGGNKGDLDARWNQFKQLETMWERGGASERAEGIIKPNLLANEARRKGRYLREWEDFISSASSVMTDRLNNSGTPARTAMLNMMGFGGAAGAGTAALLEPSTLLLSGGAVSLARGMSGQLARGNTLNVGKLLYDGRHLRAPQVPVAAGALGAPVVSGALAPFFTDPE